VAGVFHFSVVTLFFYTPAKAEKRNCACSHLIGVRPLEGALVGVQIPELQEAHLAQVAHSVVRGLSGHDELHQLHLLGTKQLHHRLRPFCAIGLIPPAPFT
jgi:hypothetical protein